MHRLTPILFLLTLSAAAAPAPADPLITDLFHRDISSSGLTLPDWEGYMANPAIQFTITPPPGVPLPARVTLTAPNSRLYFDLPSDAGPNGPKKEITITDRTGATAHIAAFPLRIKRAEESALTITLRDGLGHRFQQIVPLHLAPIVSTDRSPPLPVTADFSQDHTSFYKDPNHRAIFQQAINDWAFYLKDFKPRPVPAGDEKTFIFRPDGFNHSDLIPNPAPFTGVLLYAYGIHTSEIRSGGEVSSGAFQQTPAGRSILHRSGGVEVEIAGNYNTLGWLPAQIAEQQWWRDTNLGNVQNDLYSIMHHESGHALFFNIGNQKFPRNAVLKDPNIRAYLRRDIKTDLHDHFDGFIDPASLHGAFGNEYHGQTPYGRWLITRLDLLGAQAIGYPLRPLAPVLPLSIQTDQLAAAHLQRPYSATLIAQGGIPVYDWQIQTGALPPGFTLNRFTGQLSGAPARVGDFPFTLRLRDYDAAGAGLAKQFQITVAG